MLPAYFKLTIKNSGDNQLDFSTDGANNTFTVKGYGVKLDGTFGAQETLFADPTADLASNAFLDAASEINNSSNQYIGYWCTAELLTDANDADGQVDIFLQWSNDKAAAATYVSDAGDYDGDQDLVFVGQVRHTATASEDRHSNFFLTAPIA